MTAVVTANGLTKRFKNQVALDGATFQIESGRIVGLIGPNGAGKTTLISSLAGLVRPDSGTLEVMGHDVQSDYRHARRNLGVVPQEIVFDPFFSVRETLKFQSGYFGIRNNDDWIDEILANLDLTNKAHANMRALSGGMKRRVMVAQALVHRPPVIVLDEPTAGVDVELRQTLWQFIRRLNQDGHTIVLTTHYLEEAESLCSRIAMLKAGRVVALDSTENLLNSHANHALRFRLADGDVLPAVFDGRATRSEDVWVLPFENYSEVGALVDTLNKAGCTLRDLEIGKPDLEDVFIDVMKGRAA